MIINNFYHNFVLKWYNTLAFYENSKDNEK